MKTRKSTFLFIFNFFSTKAHYSLTGLLLSILIGQVAVAQEEEHSKCKFAQMQGKQITESPLGTAGRAGITVSGENYDVKYYRLELRVNPDSTTAKYIKGKITTYFRTGQANFNQIKFDFASTLLCDSVYYHNAKLAAGNISKLVDTLRINIPTIAILGTLDSVTVFYKGVPPVVPDFSGGTGFVKSTHGSPVANYIYTLSEPYSSYTWWPCKSFIVNDKADSMRMIVSTPSTFKVASNGTLISEVVNGANKVTTWFEKYPIAAYQVAIGVANYVQYPAVPTLVNIGGTNMPFYNYLFPETNTVAAQTALNRTASMLTVFSSKFSDYPFKDEKYGHYTFGFGGGMEHNTFSGMNPSTYNATTDWNVIAHELGHQWFGASATCKSWRDIWVNESFAEWSESIAVEFDPVLSAAVGQTATSWRSTYKSQAVSASYQVKAIYAPDTTSITTIFTPAVYIYQRGAMVISMLRILLGDTKFFQAIQNYSTDPLIKHSSALTNDVKRHMEAVSGLNLTTFFNQWIYNTGYANYNVEWNNTSNKIKLRLVQTPQFAGALPHFDMPVAVRIRGALVAQDTTVIIYDNNGTMNYVVNGNLVSTGLNTIGYYLSFVPTTVTFDSYNQTMATATVSFNNLLSTLPATLLTFKGNKNNENVQLYWTIDNALELASIEIEKSVDQVNFGSIGSVDMANGSTQTSFSFTDKNIPSGTFYYRIKMTQKSGEVLYSKVLALGSNSMVRSYKISPNPAVNYLTIKGRGISEKVDIKIFDATGRMVKNLPNQFFSATGSVRIPIIELNDGTYFVQIELSDNSRFSETIVIKK